MIIRCTKELLAEWRITELAEEPETDLFWCWHENLITVERRKCVLLNKRLNRNVLTNIGYNRLIESLKQKLPGLSISVTA